MTKSEAFRILSLSEQRKFARSVSRHDDLVKVGEDFLFKCNRQRLVELMASCENILEANKRVKLSLDTKQSEAVAMALFAYIGFLACNIASWNTVNEQAREVIK